MKRYPLIFALCVFALVIASLTRQENRGIKDVGIRVEKIAQKTVLRRSFQAERLHSLTAPNSHPTENTPESVSRPNSANQDLMNRPETLSFQNIFRMTLDGGECRLNAVEKVSGDFSSRRKEPDLHSGMLLCKLVSKNGALLAEKAVHVPDHFCRVVDPRSTRDEPEVVLFSGLGPQVFQVRFPAHLSGRKLDVYRVTKTRPTAELALLLTIPIN